MPLDTWETNSAFEIGTLALRPSHHVSAIAHITNRSMTPDAGPSHPLAPKRPMTEGVQMAANTLFREEARKYFAASGAVRFSRMENLKPTE